MKKILLILVLVFVCVNQAKAQNGDGEGIGQDTNTNNATDSSANVVGDIANTVADSGKNPPIQTVPTLTYKSIGGAAYKTQMASDTNSCNSAASQAQTICIANSNPGMQTAVSLISKLVAAGSAGLSITASCNKFNDALKIANDAVTAYNAACAAMQYRCVSACTKLQTTYNNSRISISKQLAKDLNSTPVGTADVAASQQDLVATGDVYTAMTATLNACRTYKKNMLDAGIGLAGMVTSSALASSCKDKTTDTASAKCDATTNSLCINGVDCSQSANATNPTCICNASPNAPGCPGATNYGSTYNSPSYGATDSGGTSGTTSTSTGASSNISAVTRNAATPPASADGASNSGSSGMGGGGAISDSGMTATAQKKGQTADKKGSLNTNILSESDGGGGGGYRGGVGGSSSDYRAYMPGQTKDPSRALASQNAAAAQVTSAGSKSNWEKVNERYMENKSTLMGE